METKATRLQHRQLLLKDERAGGRADKVAAQILESYIVIGAAVPCCRQPARHRPPQKHHQVIPRQKPHENLRKEAHMDQAEKANPNKRGGRLGRSPATPITLDGHGASGGGASPQPLYCPPGCRV